VSVSLTQLIQAASELAEWFGLDSKIDIRIRCYDVGMLGSIKIEGCRAHSCVELYADAIREWSRSNSKSMRETYAIVLVHEMVHLSQEFRGSSNVPDEAEENEALALEKVYAPHVLRILQGRAKG